MNVEVPLQVGLYMHKEMSSMGLHSIVVLEEGAPLHLVTGCMTACILQGGLHIAISEHFVGESAHLINIMIHNWGPEFIVRPRSGTIAEEAGSYINNYFSIKPPSISR